MDPELEPPSTVAVDFVVRRLAWSPDGRKLAVAGDGPSSAIAALVDAESGLVDWQEEVLAPGTIKSIGFAPDGAAFAVGMSGDAGGVAKLLDCRSGNTLWERAGGWIQDFVFSPDGQLLAVSDGGRVRVVEVATGAERFTSIGAANACPFTPAFSADSRSIALVAGRQCQMVDTTTGEQRWTIAGPSGLPGALPSRIAFAADDTRLVLARLTDTVDVLASDTGALLSSSGLAGAVPVVTLFLNAAFDFSTDGSRVMKAQRGFTPDTAAIGVWATGDGSARFPVRPLARSPSPELIDVHYISKSQQWVRFSPDGRRGVVACGETAPGFMVLDAETGDKLVEDLSEPTVAVAFDRGGGSLAVAGERSVRIFLKDRIKLRHDLGAPVKAVTISAGGARRVGACTEREASVFDVESGERMLVRQYAIAVLTALTISADGEALAAADASGGVDLYAVAEASRIWHAGVPGSPVVGMAFLPTADRDLVTATGNPAPAVRRLSLVDGTERWACRHPRAITQIAVDPTGRWVATGCADGMTRVIDATSGAVQPITIQRSAATRTVLFARAGSTLLSADANGVVLADPATGLHLDEVTLPDLISAVDISRDGSLLATVADDHLRLFSVTGATVARLSERTFAAELTHVRFSPGTQRLCAATADGTVWILDLPTLTTRKIHRHPQRVNALAFSSDAQLLVTACADGILRAYAESF